MQLGEESQKASQAAAPVEVFDVEITLPSNLTAQFRV